MGFLGEISSSNSYRAVMWKRDYDCLVWVQRVKPGQDTQEARLQVKRRNNIVTTRADWPGGGIQAPAQSLQTY